jgi:hypothetical protein
MSVHAMYPTIKVLTESWPLKKYTYYHLSHAAFSTSTKPSSARQKELQNSNPENLYYEQASWKRLVQFPC